MKLSLETINFVVSHEELLSALHILNTAGDVLELFKHKNVYFAVPDIKNNGNLVAKKGLLVSTSEGIVRWSRHFINCLYEPEIFTTKEECEKHIKDLVAQKMTIAKMNNDIDTLYLLATSLLK